MQAAPQAPHPPDGFHRWMSDGQNDFPQRAAAEGNGKALQDFSLGGGFF